MKFLQIIVCISMLVFSSQACPPNVGDCDPICGSEIKDPTNQRTFKNSRAMERWNDNTSNDDEKYQELHTGRCEPIDVCPEVYSPICTIPESGCAGLPITFNNFCELEKYNSEHLDAEYEYYHDDECNLQTSAEAEDCDCLECEIDKWEPVCSLPVDLYGRPVTFSNYCWLQKFNCALPDYQMTYWHESNCYTDEILE